MPLRFSYLSVTRRLFLIALLAAVFLPPAPTAADPRFAPLSKRGVVAIVRHARATGTGDPASFTLDDCATQRNLHSQGRKQAREIGAAIRAAVATVHWALTCRWCRCRDTASLLDLGPVEDLPALNCFSGTATPAPCRRSTWPGREHRTRIRGHALAERTEDKHGIVGRQNVHQTEPQMPRRISSSQYRSKLRQAQSKLKQAQNKQRQAVNKFNQGVRTYNSKVRTHNARVRANRDRLRRELQKLAREASQPRYVTFRTSVQTVQRSYAVLERRADANLYDDRFNLFLDLSEREAANSVSVINALQGEEPETPQDEEPASSQIDHVLVDLPPDIRDRWLGALYALNPKNPDAARHFCTSAPRAPHGDTGTTRQ